MSEINKKLVGDIKLVLSDLDDMVDEIKGKTSKEVAELQGALKDKIAVTKSKIEASEQDLLMKEQVAVEMTDEYVHSNAWKFAFVAAVMGFLIGYLV
jgi:ElaB/YqjD/DUF883 family membrane-anchored ribosome-binding protein